MSSGLTRQAAVLSQLDDANGAGGMCTLEMWTELSSGGRPLTRCRIIDDPPELPDGTYQLEFLGQRVITNKFDGRWGLSYLGLQVSRENGLKDKGAA